MKRSLTVLFVFVLMIGSDVVAQDRLTYLETNVGLSYNDDFGAVFPGLSFLYGRQTFVSERSFWDVQSGLALPTVVTMKVGRGFKSPRTGRTFSGGVRIYPAHLYLQLGFPNPRCSNEVSQRMKKRLERRGSDRTNLLCGEWNFSIEYGGGQFDKVRVPIFGTLEQLSVFSVAIVSFSHRWYFE